MPKPQKNKISCVVRRCNDYKNNICVHPVTYHIMGSDTMCCPFHPQAVRIKGIEKVEKENTGCPDCGSMGMPVGEGNLYCDECDKVFKDTSEENK